MSLTPAHLTMLTQESGIAVEVVEERGWRSITAREALTVLPPLGFSAQVARLGAGLLFPLTLPTDPLPLYQFRPDHPRRGDDGDCIKYEIPHKRPQRLIVHPRVMAAVRTGLSPLYITEGAKKVDSLISRGAVALGGIGVWSFTVKRTAAEKRRNIPKVLLPDWGQVQLQRRPVVIVFDSDAVLNTDVDQAEQELAALLRQQGATVQRVRLPAQADGRKQGVDDFFACGHSLADLEARVEPMPRPRFATISAPDLYHKTIPPARWVIPGKLPVGATLFYGRSKDGKSLMVWNIAMAVVTGGKALGAYDVEQGDVLYLALEDGERRGQERLLDQMLHAAMPEPPAGLDLVFWTAPRIGEGFLEHLETWLDDHPQGRLIIVDILEKIRPPRTRDGVYTDDYNALEDLQQFGQRHNVGILIVHHANKANPQDFRESASGSQGLTGACDTLWNLRRNADSPDALLKLISREFDKHDLALRFEDGFWSVLGEAQAVRISKESQEVLDALRAAGTPLLPKDLAARLGIPVVNMRMRLKRMLMRGEVGKEGEHYLPRERLKKTPQAVTPVTPVLSVMGVTPVTLVHNDLKTEAEGHNDPHTEAEMNKRNRDVDAVTPDKDCGYSNGGPGVTGVTGGGVTPVASITPDKDCGYSNGGPGVTGVTPFGAKNVQNENAAPESVQLPTNLGSCADRNPTLSRHARYVCPMPLCGSTAYWENACGQKICARCHPQPKGG